MFNKVHFTFSILSVQIGHENVKCGVNLAA